MSNLHMVPLNQLMDSNNKHLLHRLHNLLPQYSTLHGLAEQIFTLRFTLYTILKEWYDTEQYLIGLQQHTIAHQKEATSTTQQQTPLSSSLDNVKVTSSDVGDSADQLTLPF